MLKILAVILMTLDHIGAYFGHVMSPDLFLFLRMIGRLAFPIFAYNVAMGYRRTHNFFRYSLRLFGWGMVAEVIMRWAQQEMGAESHPNVLFTLALGLVFITAYELFTQGNYDRLVRLEPIQDTPGEVKLPHQYRFNLGFEMPPHVAMILGFIFMGLTLWAGWYFQTDYAEYGILMIFLFHLALKKPQEEQFQAALLYQSFFHLLLLSLANYLHYFRLLPEDFLEISDIQGLAVLAVFLIFKLPAHFPQADRKPSLAQKYFFYLYYPLHLVVMALIYKYLL
ncbi:MAG: TraX family protein [Eubacteriales bacterium]|nr:TraX family protein [Clostridiales bacterium]MDY5835824.1 TraX family protein [Eubacteriales bacterium]